MGLGPSRGALSDAQNGQSGTPAQSRYMMDVESAPESFRSAVGMFGLHARNTTHHTHTTHTTYIQYTTHTLNT
jgi:hypothetical protein